jgi:hypothetical protein
MKTAPSIAAVLEAIEEEHEIWSERYRTAFWSQHVIERLNEVHAATNEKVRQLEEARIEKERQAEQARADAERRQEFEALLRTAEKASDVFALGERVRNERHGEGVVVAMDGPTITIDFDDPKSGRKTAGHFRYFEPATLVVPSSKAGFRVGDYVRHSRFGAGIVAAVDGDQLGVEFDTAGQKIVPDSFVECLFPVVAQVGGADAA